MAQTLQSPGVSVSVIDESFYTPAAPGTIPLIFVATEENKQNASGTGIAPGTLRENAGVIWVITSQQDLVSTFGTPYFQTVSGTPVNASEVNEYGLQSAYSVLGVSSQAYVVRADVDLGQIVGSNNQPTGTPMAGSIWVDTADSNFGINVWNASANYGQGGFSLITPSIIDESNSANVSNGIPLSSYGTVGSYAMVIPGNTNNGTPTTAKLFYKSSTLGWIAVTNGFDGGKSLTISPNYNYPVFNSSTATGSVWVCTTPVTNGASWDVKYFNGNKDVWTSVNAPVYGSKQQAIQGLDSVGGGANIPLNSIFVNADTNETNTADFSLWIRNNTGITTVSVVSGVTSVPGTTFTLRETLSSGAWGASHTIHVQGSGINPLGQQIAAAINTSSSIVNVYATWNASTNNLTINHALGGEIELIDTPTGNPLSQVGISAANIGNVANLYRAASADGFALEVSNWYPMTYTAQPTAPGETPADGTMWFNNYQGDADILYNNGTAWVGYLNQFPSTDPNGPIISASAPLTQSGGNSLVTGDIWINSSAADNFGQVIYVYNTSAGTGANGWVLQDTTDHTSPYGWVFADARWSNTGTTVMETVTPIATLLTSNYIDPDAPSPLLYPRGTRLYNTRRSSNNVKMYMSGYFNANGTNPYANNESEASYCLDRWVTASPNNAKGQGQFGRLAQRSVVVQALQAVVKTSTGVRDTDTLKYNLIATPGYTELIPEMVELNSDIGQLALVLGDTPMRLASDATTLQNWGSNAAKAAVDGDAGLVTADNYLAVYYPSGYTNDNKGNNVVVPASHMLLNTIINNDNVAYPWFAPAGTNRGGITNASSVGYVDANGNFVTTSLYQGLRDVLAGVHINPIATLPGAGLTVMGQYTRDASSTALNRINVARLVCYLRRQLNVLSKPFLFEPNDSQTRSEIKSSIENLLLELVAQRAIYDYVVVCDTTNNTPTRIDQNELWVDVAIEPVKSVEFIYIPLRLLNTGAIASGNYGKQATGSNNSSTGQ